MSELISTIAIANSTITLSALNTHIATVTALGATDMDIHDSSIVFNKVLTQSEQLQVDIDRVTLELAALVAQQGE